MALFTLATATALFDVLDGSSVTIPLEGAWVAHLELGEDEALELGPATLQIAREEGEPELFVGTIVSSNVFEGRALVELVAGAGVLATNAGAVHYAAAPSPVPAADLVSGIVATAGEQLALGVVEALTGLTAARWTRVTGETWARALARVAERYGLAWRILDTGTVWVGVEAWAEVSEEPFLELDELRARILHIAFDEAVYRPGTVVLGKRIARVTYWSDGRAELLYEESDLELFRRLVSRVAKTSPYAITYAADVVVQNEDGTLDLRLVDGPIVDIPRVPFDTGVEGARYVIPPGAQVRVAFLGGRPDGAYAFGRPHEAGAEKPVVRVGDAVDCGTLAAALVGGAVELTYTPPGGLPGAPAASVSLIGVVSSGSAEVFIR